FSLPPSPSSAPSAPPISPLSLHDALPIFTLSRGLATLDLPADFRYLDPQETDIVLRAWGNPPGRETLGMLVPAGVQVLTPEGWGDRKSTRLNSSHEWISYAVFCLKKKKTE